MTCLEYESKMLQEALDEDSLMIFSAGLSLNRILVEMFKHYVQSKSTKVGLIRYLQHPFNRSLFQFQKMKTSSS